LSKNNIRLQNQYKGKDITILNLLWRMERLAHCELLTAVLMALPSIVVGEYGEAERVTKIGIFDVRCR
jgi:hypothetical protein